MNISAKELAHWLDGSRKVAVLDVRRDDQRERWPLAGIDTVEADLEKLSSDDLKTTTILVCQFGIITQRWIEAEDLDEVYNLIGGAQAWNAFKADRRDLSRYSRQMVLPEIGEEGQRKLLDSLVTIVGVGGLGCPAAQYLSAAGVGKLNLIDGDVVDITNLQRQPLFRSDRIGDPKSDVAAEALSGLNPDCAVESIHTFISEENCQKLLAGSDVVLDATDNITARRLMDQYCCRKSIPLIYGGLYKFEGQVSVFHLNGGPSYADVFPESVAGGGTCSDDGVPGMLPGIIGSIQALEAIKVILGITPNLSGILLLYNGLSHTMEQIELNV
ncbi:MAG: ThiF family adenylyltransferase [Candidatus Marinimicrobia bacterium]|nr:ThiF family adenylyltransferase [Candidatus Neomarinimicrobiota bacterium]